MKNQLRIAYDARFSIGQYRGMGHYLRTLIAGREQNLLGLCAAGEHDPDLRLVAEGPSFYPAWEQLTVPQLVKQRDIDVFIAPYNTAPIMLPRSTRLVLIVHDLIFLDPMPASRSIYQNSGRIYRRLIVPRVIPRADLIVTVSQSTASLLESRFAVDKRRLRIIPNSVSEEWFVPDSAVHSSGDYVLAVAGEAPSKNLNRALEAFALCRAACAPFDLRMKVAGVKRGFHAGFAARARELDVGDRVEFLPYLPHHELRTLYRNAAVFFMPSLAEGFGIPVLEAMASGVPVASSNASSLPEICGDAALLFDPTSIEHMARILHQTLFDFGLRTRLIRSGRVQAGRFHPNLIRLSIDAFWEQLGQSKSTEHEVELV